MKMKNPWIATTLIASVLANACQPTAQSKTDTTAVTASSSTQTSVVQTPVGSAVPGSGSTTTTASGSKTSKQTGTVTKSTKKVATTPIQKSTATDTSIRGWDSVIKMKMKTYPTTSSTPKK